MRSSGIHEYVGSWITPPTIDNPARTTSGNSITGGDSCGLNSPWAPCSSAWLSHLASPKNTIMTWRVM